MQDKVRIGLIGTGQWAEMIYLPSFQSHPLADVVALCYHSNRERAEGVATQYDIPTVYTDYHQLLKHDGLDAVVVASPDDLHYPMTMEALDANLHVLCEKPIALNAQQASEMYEKAEGRGVKHMIFFTWRWHPKFTYMKHLVDEGYIGRCFYADFNFLYSAALHQNYTWRFDARRANGVLGDLGSHMIDFARWYVGDIVKVNAQLDIFSKRPGFDNIPLIPANDLAAVQLQFANGAQGSIRVSGLALEMELNARICGDLGYLDVNWLEFDPNVGFKLRGARQGENHFTVLKIPDHYIEGMDLHNLTDLFVKQNVGPRLFVDAIIEDKSITPNFLDGLEVQKVVDAALESDRTGCWVDINV